MLRIAPRKCDTMGDVTEPSSERICDIAELRHRLNAETLDLRTLRP